ncbi:MAG: cytochrome c-type biogenesis protein CcmH [Gammaproteobacteria bacterium HGW-Gammaproteobacteria-3]|nr:MAG: cytochrome c-type biogenesis protein CcmH [Gammaproteobacteria bacterium HGW-Gammaproteobacteria-3]
MRLFFLLIFILAAPNAGAGVEVKQFASTEQEQAYTDLISELRCLVCQNQSIAESNAELAQDLRQQVYTMLQQGQSRQAIIDFMTQRYGDFVLYRPPFKTKTLLLWLAPVVFFMAGLVIVWRLSRKRKRDTVSAQDAERIEKARQLLEQGEDL